MSTAVRVPVSAPGQVAVDTFDNVENSINRQTEFALSEAVRDLNRPALYGHRVEPGIATNGAFGGRKQLGICRT